MMMQATGQNMFQQCTVDKQVSNHQSWGQGKTFGQAEELSWKNPFRPILQQTDLKWPGTGTAAVAVGGQIWSGTVRSHRPAEIRLRD
jgi:hypothetical protein